MKEFYDPTTGNQVSDNTGQKTLAQIRAEFPNMSAMTQEVIVLPGEATEIVDGTLQTFNIETREETEAITRETARQQAEDNFKTSLGWTDQQYIDFKNSIGL